MPRTFDGTDDRIVFSVGTGNIAFGTIACILDKNGGDGNDQSMVVLGDTSTHRFGLRLDTSDRILMSGAGGLGPNSTLTVTASQGWQFVCVTKGTGTVTPRAHRYLYDTDTWTHENMSATLADYVTTSTALYMGSTEDNLLFFNGDIAAAGIWDVAMTDSQVEALAFSLMAWWQISPKTMWVLDQAGTGMLVNDLTGNGANESGKTGTAVGGSSVPVFTYGHPVIWTPQFIDTTPDVVDAGAGSDSITVLTAALPVTDSGAGSEVASVSLTKEVTDSGVGTDNASVACKVIVVTHLTDGASATNGTVFNTASVAPGANELALIAVVSSHTSTPSLPTLAGGGMTTWTQVSSTTFGTGSNFGRLTIFRALQASPGAPAAITITHPSSVGACAWSVDKFQGVKTSGTNGADALREVKSDSDGGADAQGAYVEMGFFEDPDNVIWGAVGRVNQEATTPYSGAVETADRVNGDGTVPGALETAYSYESEDLTWGWATRNRYGWAAIELSSVTGCRDPGVPTDFPQFILEINLNDPTNATKNWKDISNRVISWKRSGPKRTFELDTIETATLEVKCRNHDRALDPEFTTGPYYGLLFSNREIRAKWLYRGRWHHLFYGFIEDFDADREGFSGQYATLKANDATEILHAETLDSGPATLTTSQGSNKDLTFTAKSTLAGDGNELATMHHANPLGGHHTPPGEGSGLGESVYVEYLLAPGPHPCVALYDSETNKITVYLDNLAGAPNTKASTIMAVVNSNPQCSKLVKVTLAPGSNGTGIPAVMSATPLAGGFSSERSGLRVNRALSALEHPWPMGDRIIDYGSETIQASAIEKRSNVSCMTHLQDVAVVTELGLIFLDGKSRVVFQDRATRSDPTVFATFTDKAGVGGEYPYHDIKPNYDNKRIFNEIVVTANGSDVPYTTSDAASITRFRKRTKTLTVLCLAPAAAGGAGFETALLTIGEILLGQFSSQKARYDKMVVRVGMADPVLELLLALKISHLLTINRNPTAGPGAVSDQISTNHFCEGYDIEQDDDKFVTYTVYLSPA